jgi:hypothetical protein
MCRLDVSVEEPGLCALEFCCLSRNFVAISTALRTFLFLVDRNLCLDFWYLSLGASEVVESVRVSFKGAIAEKKNSKGKKSTKNFFAMIRG